ncbi:MAG: response regulator transcription factor [Cryomorphaceae bacterium]|nr:response regulator transcription factor [Cryomorphaceae bacterium]
MKDQEIHVLVADDHSIVRRGAIILLQRMEENFIVHQAENLEDAVGICSEHPIRLVILDIKLPGGNHSNMVREILGVNSKCKILVFTSYEEEAYAEAFLRAGALGFINKLSSEDDIAKAIETTLAGRLYISDNLKEKIKAKGKNKSVNPLSTLSTREMEVARLLSVGKGNLEIKNEIGLQPSTISTYKMRIFRKLNVDNIADLIDTFRRYDVK